MSDAYPGFPAEGIEFLRQLKENNNREWFQARKSTYEKVVKQPMLDLIDALNGRLVQFAPDYVTEPAKALYRIYRDTRFSKDKTPYKTNVAATFNLRGAKNMALAGYYFQISPENVGIGGGIYHPPPKELLAIRTWIADNWDESGKVIQNRKTEALMGEIYGDQLSRPPKGFAKDHPGEAVLRRKSLIFYTELPPESALKPTIVEDIATRFEATTPLIHMLNRALGASAKT